jgi:sodium/proline symporter
VFSFSFYIAAQFQAAGGTFSNTFNMNSSNAILLGASIILIYTLLGGFWAVSVTDTIQGLLMAVCALILPIVALIEVGGVSSLTQQLSVLYTPSQLSLTQNFTGWLGISFVIGMLGVGLGYTGQPHVLNRFMAIKDEQSLKVGKYIGIGWPIIVYGGMLVLGLCARVLIPQAENNEQVLFGVTELLFHPIIAGVIIAAVLSAIMSTADSQLLVSASSLSYDLKLEGSVKKQLFISRITVTAMCLISLLISLYAPDAIFSRVLFAWAAIGSGFGPLIIMILAGYNIKGGYRLLAIFSGFTLTVYFNWQPNSPGDVLERVLPFIIAGVIAFMGREKRTD